MMTIARVKALAYIHCIPKLEGPKRLYVESLSTMYTCALALSPASASRLQGTHATMEQHSPHCNLIHRFLHFPMPPYTTQYMHFSH